MSIRYFTSLVFCLLSLHTAQAQMGAVMVQQPVVSSFGAATTVSVPDRGNVLIGGVTSAESGSTRFGPLPTGSAYGSTWSSTSTRAHVWIHDPAGMDAALLRLGESRVSGLSPLARDQRARNILRNRSGLSVPIVSGSLPDRWEGEAPAEPQARGNVIFRAAQQELRPPDELIHGGRERMTVERQNSDDRARAVQILRSRR